MKQSTGTGKGLRSFPRHRKARGGATTLRLDAAEVAALYGFLALGAHFAATVSGEKSLFSPDEIRMHSAAIRTNASNTLVDKLFAAAVTAETTLRQDKG
jgi:hypothetical protein